jgi:chaperonin cofactor prefoldin
MTTASIPENVLLAVAQYSELQKKVDQIMTDMKPLRAAMKEVRLEQVECKTIMENHITANGGKIMGDGWEMTSTVRKKKSVSVQELEGVVDREVIQSLMPDQDDLIFPIRKRKRTK